MKTFTCRAYKVKGMGVRGCIKRQFAESFGEGGGAWAESFDKCRICTQGLKIAERYPQYVPDRNRPKRAKRKVCPVCNGPFPQKVKDQKHCSRECANRAASNRWSSKRKKEAAHV